MRKKRKKGRKEYGYDWSNERTNLYLLLLVQKENDVKLCKQLNNGIP